MRKNDFVIKRKGVPNEIDDKTTIAKMEIVQSQVILTCPICMEVMSEVNIIRPCAASHQHAMCLTCFYKLQRFWCCLCRSHFTDESLDRYRERYGCNSILIRWDGVVEPVEQHQEVEQRNELNMQQRRQRRRERAEQYWRQAVSLNDQWAEERWQYIQTWVVGQH